MLPVHHEGVHHRHGGLTGSGTAGGHFSSRGRSGSRSCRCLILAFQVAVVLCVCLPLLFLLSDRRSKADLWGGPVKLGGEDTLPFGRRGRKDLKEDERRFPARQLRNLVLVAGHAVYTGLDFSLAARESSWFLEPYQKVPGEAQSFLDHIALGVQRAAQDPTALLLFSGGQTRQEAGPRSEGLSYWVAAEAAGWFNAPGVRNRTFTEEHARDSFENLLFGLCRFYELTGHYPDRITVVSYTLKQARFSTLHREAVRFPQDRFEFVGTPVPPEAKGAEEGEARTVAAFRLDPYGCSGDLLQKRLRRDPFAVGPIHPSRCPDMRALLTHCGPSLFEGRLPW